MPHDLIPLTGNNSLTLPGLFAAQSLNRQARPREIRRQQALFAFVDVLPKTFLICVPEPPRDVHDQAVARQGPLREVSQKRWHGHGGRFPGRNGGGVRPRSRKLRASGSVAAPNVAGKTKRSLVRPALRALLAEVGGSSTSGVDGLGRLCFHGKKLPTKASAQRSETGSWSPGFSHESRPDGLASAIFSTVRQYLSWAGSVGRF
jgi:hypothetical protein